MCGPSNPHRREVAFNTRPCGVPLEALSPLASGCVAAQQALPTGRYSLLPLAAALGFRLGVNGRPYADDESNGSAALAALLAVTDRTIRRWLVGGLTEQQADRLAVQVAHRHPVQLWPSWFDDALAAA